MIIRETKPEDFELVNTDAMYGTPDLGWCFTMCDGDGIVGIMGTTRFWGEVGTVWLLVADESVRHSPVSLTRMCKRLLDYTVNRGEFSRYQAFVLSANERDKSWAEFLGFKYESTMAQGSPTGTDIDIYTIVRP